MAAIEIAALLAVAWPGIAVVSDRRFRSAFPRESALVAALLAGWVALIALVALVAPVALHALAPLAVLVAVAGLIRARPGYGRRRGLPPGSLSVSRSIRGLANRRTYLRAAERYGPIFKAAQFHRGMICVVGLERGHRLLREHDERIGSAPLPLTDDITGGFLRYMDGETHRRYGPLLRAAQSRPVTEASEPAIEAAAARGLGALAERRGPGRATAPGPWLERIVHDSFLAALFGIDHGSATCERFNDAYGPLADQAISEPLSTGSKRALAELRPILRAHLDRIDSDGARRCALTELRDLDPEMPDDVCLDNLLLTLRIASANVTSLLHWLLEMLGRHPEWGDRAAGELEARPDEGRELLDRIISETLRLNQSEYLYRVLDDEVVFDGFRLPAGWLLRICVWESHRDPASFPEPERFDPDRFLDPAIGTARYSPFGRGEHACNGIPLTRSIARATLAEMLTGFEWRLIGTGRAEHDFRHWSHWMPGSGLALELDRAETPTGAPHAVAG